MSWSEIIHEHFVFLRLILKFVYMNFFNLQYYMNLEYSYLGISFSSSNNQFYEFRISISPI